MPEPEEEGAEVGSWATTVVLALVAIGAGPVLSTRSRGMPVHSDRSISDCALGGVGASGGASAWTLAKLARDPEQRARVPRPPRHIPGGSLLPPGCGAL